MRAFCFSVLLLALLGAGSVGAQDPGAFEGETVVAGQDAGEREAALPRALGDLLVKLTGNPEVAGDPALADRLAQAPALLQQFRYRQSAGRLWLVASFERGAVERLLADAGHAIWPQPRPQPLVWLAIDDGRGPRLVGTAQAQAVAALTERAAARGVRVSFPLLDLDDQRSIDAGRVWAGDASAVAAATGRYGASTALFGKLHRSAGGWSAEWNVLADGEVVGRQRSSDADAATVLAAGADMLATTLARLHVDQQQDAGPPGSHALWLEGIDSAADYARAMAYLQRQPLVRGLLPMQAGDGRLRLQVDLASGIDALVRRVGSDDVLQPLPAAADGERRFQLRP